MAGSKLAIIGAVLALVGLLAYAIPVFTTKQTKEVAKVGDVKLTHVDESTHVIPPLVSGGAVLLGVVLLGAGLYARR